MYKILHTDKEKKKYQVKLVPLETVNEKGKFLVRYIKIKVI